MCGMQKNYSKYRFCIDFKKDYLLFKKIIDEFKNNVYNISMLDLIKYVNKNKKLLNIKKILKEIRVGISH